MRKFLTILMLLSFAITAWAGEKTITISRNDVDWENANTVYNVTKGGVELVMSGGMNNPNFLLMKQHTTITVKSHNFNIKRIVFHCLDNYTNDNLDPFYWGPTTLHIQYSQTHAETAGTLTYNYGGSTYDALWVSTKSSSPGNYPNGLPAGYELMFENEGKPVRFASIDITVEQESGDMYELVTSTSELNTTNNYMLVGRSTSQATDGYAMSVNTTGSSATDNIKSTKVQLIDNGLRVKANDETQFLKLQTGTGNNTYRYYVKAGTNTIRSQSTYESSQDYNHGFCLTKVNNLPSSDYVITKITINDPGDNYASNWDYYADIRYKFTDPYSNGNTYALRHNNDYKQFRNLYNNNSRQRVYLYKPAQQYEVSTQVVLDANNNANGSIALRDGILVDNGINWSQKMETVQFLVTPADGYKVKSVTIQEVERDANHNVTQVLGTIDILNSSQSINGTLYNFVMPGNDVHIVVEFEEVQYHNVNIVVKPNMNYGSVFLTEGYVVQNDQVKSYDGENIVFNVTANPKDPENPNSALYELYSVTVTYTQGGEEISYNLADGNYNFTMPDADVTITATFVYENGQPLYLLGTANGNETWLPYGPRFNYDPDGNNGQGQYYIDVYFKGTGNYGENTGDSNGYFSFVWKKGTTWNDINSTQDNQQNVRGVPMDDQTEVDNSPNGFRLFYYRNGANESNSYKIAAGLYRIYVISYGYDNDWMYIVKNPTALTLNPTGGATAAEAVEVEQHKEITLAGDIYSKIMAINPDEPAANFKYKAVKTIGENTVADNPVPSTTTATTTLDVVNEGETVTQLDGYNYLGWIVASNTGYYKVTETPLHWIEENGVKDKTYTVSDRLQGVYAQGSSLWCKDLDISIAKTDPATGQVDYLMNDNHCKREGGWDQSNWVELDFSGFGAEGNNMATALLNQYIKENTVTGVYTDDVNYTIKVSAAPVPDGTASYVPNTYCTVNFLESNLMLNAGDTGPSVTKDGTTTYYYFLNPKIQEYAIVTYCMWDKDNQIMVTPNNAPFNGAAKIGRWDLNYFDNQLTALDAAFDATTTCNNQYEFHIIVQRTNKSYGSPITSKDVPSLKPDQTASEVLRTQPLDLQASSPLPTTISIVGTQAQVVDVEYVNVAGMRSSKPFNGVNIVVTRYSDGSTTTTKIVK
ncbi:MAG: hypothetical protein J6X22_08020 [Muribaculaceae bacterium]|nr:hypothetical protein [Muribaculaceae bacterium]